MNNYFTPKNVIVGQNSNRSNFTASEYDFDTFANLQLGSLGFTLFGGFLIGIFLSPIIFIFSLFSFNGKFNFGFLSTSILSGYTLLDAYKGWYMLEFTHILFDEGFINKLMGVNIAVLIISLILLIFSNSIKTILILSSETISGRWVGFFMIVGILFFFSYSIGNKVITNNTGWVIKNLKIDVRTPEQIQEAKYVSKTDKQIEDEENKRFNDELIKEGLDPNGSKY